MKINIKRLAVVALALLMGTAAVAQTTSKQINQIKRSPLYLYAEATMETEEEARNTAYELLVQQVQEYIASSNFLSQADNVLIKDVQTKGETLSMMRGEMHRVFVYVRKYDIEAVSNTMAVNNSTGAAVNVSASPAPAAPVQQVAAPTAQPVAEPAQPVTGGQQAVSPLTGWQQQAMVSLLECADMTALRAKLNRLKAEYKIKRYGTADNCPSATDAYWAVFDGSGKLVTILGPGTGQRVDYKNMQYSSLERYKGMNALWFNFAK